MTSGRFRRGALDDVRDEQVESHVLRLDDLLLGAGELDELRDERRHLTQLLDDVRRGAAVDPPVGSVRSPASTSMFVRTLVSGVRSSCDASATSWRCARVDSSSAASIVLKLAASRLSSSLPGDVDPLGEILRLAHALDRLREPPHRA